MGLNPLKASENIIEKYLRYIETTFYIDDKEYMKQFQDFLAEPYHFAKGPFLDFADSFESGNSIQDLILEGILSEEFAALYRRTPNLLSRALYKHQEMAIRNVKMGRNIVVTTGTGSGKTEAFLIPIINYLMGQKESNELNDGVRALIIYPMNALANDQMKRMRELFNDYPDITFGAYTGETEQDDRRALSKYMSLNNGLKPIQNEMISRDQMKDKPPHIFITNYAMLEYLLLRPDDNVFFSGDYSDNWKFIVLDEAHTYTGATGIEVSMLLRRLRHTLNSHKPIQFILTSATLGDEKDNDEICDFASRLCTGEIFNKDSIVRASRYKLFDQVGAIDYPSKIYHSLNEMLVNGVPISDFEELIRGYNTGFKSSADCIPELLYDILVKDNFYYKMREVLSQEPITIDKIAEQLSADPNDLVDFVAVARKAEKNSIMLLDARYHMFVRALEGAYVTLGIQKDLSITPRDKTYIAGQEYKSFKISVCQFCGHIYLEAKILEGYLVQKKENERNNQNHFYMLRDEVQEPQIVDEDMIPDDDEDVYILCGKCGKIEKMNLLNGKMCDCGKENFVSVLEIKPKNLILNKCSACGLINTQGTVLRGFYLGQEAAASVIGSSLYEEIPCEEIQVTEVTHEFDDDFFGHSSIETSVVKDVLKKRVEKQLLVFSDSRQEAAFFASYFDFTYNNILRRRLFIEALKDLGQNSTRDTSEYIDISTAANRLAALFEQHKILDSTESLKEAWKTILYEISSNDRNSLEGLGLVSFEYQSWDLPKLQYYEGKDVAVIQRVLANSFKRDCMFEFPLSKEMLKADKEYYSYKGSELAMSLIKSETKNIYCKAWIPSKGSNARFNYIKKTTLGAEKKEIVKFLENMWLRVFSEKDKYFGGLVIKKPNEYVMDISKFKIRASFVHDMVWYICNKCGKVTVNNINDKCPANRCDGTLKICHFDNDFSNNHYRKQYLELDIFPMRVKEHTAQLSPETAKKYQEMFIRKEINVLSCSTTFEMGVDVGELETVFMKNMPLRLQIMLKEQDGLVEERIL